MARLRPALHRQGAPLPHLAQMLLSVGHSGRSPRALSGQRRAHSVLLQRRVHSAPVARARSARRPSDRPPRPPRLHSPHPRSLQPRPSLRQPRLHLRLHPSSDPRLSRAPTMIPRPLRRRNVQKGRSLRSKCSARTRMRDGNGSRRASRTIATSRCVASDAQLYEIC